MKSLFFSLILLISIVTISFSQGREHAKTASERATKQAEKLSSELGLSADQKTKIEAASLTRIQGIEQMKAKRYDSPESKRADRKSILEAFDTSLKGILSADQYAKFESREEELKSPEHKAAKESMKMKEEFGLSEDQKDQLEEALVIKHTKMMDLKENGEPDHEKMKMVRQEFKSSLKEIFTAEQFAAFEAKKEEHKGGHGEHGKGKGGKMKNKG